MNREEFIESMMVLGYTESGADDLIWIAADSTESNLTLRAFNFVTAGDDQYEIFLPGDRGGYFKASVSYGVPFRGSLEDAYLWVYNDRAGL
ncbi:hypothetical protein [Leucobacter denitrificans]|uniref:Uncharacterized protein n=1 Tax=Leucobacter denitrificans TaxID=683042 RepID=A0A7G9S263_9MICO|nr:hypothetical protein [Leucobacter denitrificans]QNN61938.1 hypothetical protein H9L06_06305 [Leucobacter denitrificans]